MKAVVTYFLCLIALSLQQQEVQDYVAKLAQFKEECVRETNVDPNLVDRMWRQGDFAEDRNLKCFIKCTYVKMNTMNEAGDFQVDAFRSSLPPGTNPTMINGVIEKCASLRGSDPCETAFVLAKCSCGVMRGH